jgi:proline utilization trans-activator
MLETPKTLSLLDLLNTENVPPIPANNDQINDEVELDSANDNGTPTGSAKRRNILACIACRKRHIKCDGLGSDCSRCTHLKLQCEYAEAEKKVVISVKYLNSLQDQISKLKVENANLRANSKSFSSSSVTVNDTNVRKPVPPSQDNDSGNGERTGKISNLNNLKHSGISQGSTPYPTESNSDATEFSGKHAESEKKNNEVIPPFLEKYGRLIHSRTGERLYIGSSSMTLFGLEINRLVAPILSSMNSESNKGKSPDFIKTSEDDAETILEKEGNAYRIMLEKTTARPGIDVNFTLPSYSYALLLVDSFISYNDGCFYFFNEGLVKENLRRIYNDDENKGFKLDYGIESLNNSSEAESILETIWFCKLLLIFAIGEMYLGTANYLNGYKINEKTRRKKRKLDNTQANANEPDAFSRSDSTATNASHKEARSQNGDSKKDSRQNKDIKLPGSGFFNQASDLFTGLFASGSIDNVTREGGIEVLLLYAFYLQVADCTAASYFYFGIALRASLLLGLHVDIGKDTLNRFELEHRRRLWWTVYMYERMLASKAGLPLSLTDEDILTELPSDFDMSKPESGCENYIFPEAEFISNCVKITQINADILRRLYTRQPSSNILPVVHELVVSLLKWKKSLPSDINCDYSAQNLEISRLIVNMMTEYFQGINLAVRPLLFHFVATNLKSSNPKEGKYLDLSKYSSVILALLNASFQASINTIRSLWALVPENMVAMFGYMDREYLFNATATLVLFDATFGVHEATKEQLDHALTLFTRMRNLGNHPATLRREQILKLLSILNFNGEMSDLIKKHKDNVKAPASFANSDSEYGYKMSVGTSSKSKTDMSPLSDSRTTSSQPLSQSSYNQTVAATQGSNVAAHDLKSVYHALDHLSNSNEFTVQQFRDFQKQQLHLQQQTHRHGQSVGSLPPFSPATFLQQAQAQAHTQSQSPLLQTSDSTPNLISFSPSLSTMFNLVDDIPEFEPLSSTANDLELWNDITHQAAWLQNDMGYNFDQPSDQK